MLVILYIVLVKKAFRFSNGFFAATTYAAILFLASGHDRRCKMSFKMILLILC